MEVKINLIKWSSVNENENRVRKRKTEKKSFFMLPTAENETDQRCFWELVDAVKETTV